MPESGHGGPVYLCNTIDDLYSASNLVIRGKPLNIEINYQNTLKNIYHVDVIEVLKGTCEEVVYVNRGFFVIHNDAVYSIGVIDGDYLSLTTGLPKPFCLTDFK